MMQLNRRLGFVLYELDDELRPRGHEYLGDPTAARRAAEAVARQGRRGT